jgi:hypothetical protein
MGNRRGRFRPSCARASSEPGHGTTFGIYIPRVVEEAAPAVAELGKLRSSSDGNETILLVEDEPAVRRFARVAVHNRMSCQPTTAQVVTV